MHTTIINNGPIFLCDMCSEDLAKDTRDGSFVFAGKAVGPCCAQHVRASIAKHKEERFITTEAAPGETFRQLCIRLRGGREDALTEITGFDSDEEMFAYLEGKRS